MGSKWFALGSLIKEEIKKEFFNILETNDYISTAYPKQWKRHQKLYQREVNCKLCLLRASAPTHKVLSLSLHLKEIQK